MLRKDARKNKHFIAQLILSVYLVAFFSQAFHSHSSHADDFSFNKIEKKSFSSEKTASHSECLACHFLATNYYTVSDDFQFIIQKDTLETEQTIAVQQRVWSQTKYTFQLRGPPNFS